MRHGRRRNFSRLAESAIGEIVLELQREEHQRHAIELDIGMGLKIGIASVLAGKVTGADGNIIRHTRRENG
jgi:hypothetical protein